MKKLILGVVLVLGLLVGGVLGAAMLQPDAIHVERTVRVSATQADVFPHVNDLQKFTAWSPWSGIDPNQKVTFTDQTAGLGAKYSWEGNEMVGTGSMEITTSTPENVVMRLIFVAPWQSEADAGFVLKPEGEALDVTWTYDQQADLSAKVMGLFIDMDDMLGGDYERGLNSLKALAEKDAQARIAAEQAQREADERAAAEAAAAAEPTGDAVNPG